MRARARARARRASARRRARSSPSSASWRRRRLWWARLREFVFARYTASQPSERSRTGASIRWNSSSLRGPSRAARRPLVGEAEEVDVIVLGREDAVDERLDDLLPLAFGDQRVRERGLARADECADAQAVPRERDQRQGADELITAEGDLDGQAIALAVMAPPLDQPAVQQERDWGAASPGRGRPTSRRERRARPRSRPSRA